MTLNLEEIQNKLLVIKKGEKDNIKIQINCLYSYEAPVQKGTRVGTLTVKKIDSKNVSHEEIIEVIPIVCQDTVQKKDVLDYVLNFISMYQKVSLK